MGASFGSQQKGRDVDINVVPFIDLMSCLTAFLLVTAVWSNHAQVDIEQARGVGDPTDEVPSVDPSILLTSTAILLAAPAAARVKIAAVGGGHDLTALSELLADWRQEAADDVVVRVAAEDDVLYQSIIDVLDVTTSAGFSRVTYVNPGELPVKLKE